MFLQTDAMIDTVTTVTAAAVKGAEKASDANQELYKAIKAANSARLSAVVAGVKAVIPGNNMEDKSGAAKAGKAVDLATAKLDKAKSEADEAHMKAVDLVQNAAAKSNAEGKAEVAAAQRKSAKLFGLATQGFIKAKSD